MRKSNIVFNVLSWICLKYITIYFAQSIIIISGNECTAWWEAILCRLKESFYFSSLTQAKGQVSYCHHWASVVRSSVNFSHFNQLLWSHWSNLNQTLVEWSLDGPLPKLCPLIPTSNQDGRQAQNRKRGSEILIVHCCFSVS